MPVGLKIHIRSSKTAQAGAGQDVAVLDRERLRVKAARADWLTTADITTGPIFLRLGKGARVLPAGLTDRSVANIIKIRAAQAGLDEALFSGHSLRAGFLTSAAESGATLVRMMDVSRYSRVDTLLGYIRSADAFKDHAGSGFM